jgi:hypothetical protein
MGSIVKKAGGLIGAGIGYALAPATGGASLALASAGLGAQLGGALQGSANASDQAKAIESAGQQAAQSTQQAADIQRQLFERQVALQEPWRQAGVGALNQLIPLASEYTPFGMQQFQQDPGYAFRMSEGMKALERSAAKRGGLLSGATLKETQRFGQDLGSQEYQNAFQRYQTERQARLNPLQSLAGVGQTSANQLGGQAQMLGQSLGNLAMTGAATQAQGGLAAANVRASQYGGLGSALGTALGSPQAQNYLARMYSGPGMGQSDFSRGYTPENYG